MMRYREYQVKAANSQSPGTSVSGVVRRNSDGDLTIRLNAVSCRALEIDGFRRSETITVEYSSNSSAPSTPRASVRCDANELVLNSDPLEGSRVAEPCDQSGASKKSAADSADNEYREKGEKIEGEGDPLILHLVRTASDSRVSQRLPLNGIGKKDCVSSDDDDPDDNEDFWSRFNKGSDLLLMSFVVIVFVVIIKKS